MRLNEHQFRSLIATIMVEEIKKLMYPKPNKVVFMLDEMSVRTLMIDSDYKNIISEAASNNWILKQSSWEINNYKRFLDIIKSTPSDKEWQFDTDKYGEPDVEGLELSKHRMKYNQHFNPYKDKFDKKTERLFKK